jgi:hypothetical protein
LRLRHKIEKYMTHSKDHLTREISRCRKGAICTYGFPHPITPETWLDDDGRVHYRRRSKDDSWIAPHIPELVDQLDCHIYVDVVFTVSVFMYLYKYFFKGPDHTLFHIAHHTPHHEEHQPIDEIKDYVRARYLSAPEAAWRILGFDITGKEPAVSSLSVHLPGQNLRQFGNEGSSASSLIRYFHRPNHPTFSPLTYIEYNQDYTFKMYNNTMILTDNDYLERPIPGSKLRVVHRRLRHKDHVARIQTVSPTAGELFYLRCLLTHRPATGFVDIRTFGTRTFNTYHEAAIHMGLFTNINEGSYAMEEALQSFVTPAQLRFLLSRLILEGYPACPLWDQYSLPLSLDFATSSKSVERGLNMALDHLSQLIEDSGRKLSQFGLPDPVFRTHEVESELYAFHGREQQLEQEADNMCGMMNHEQFDVFQTIYNAIHTHETVHGRFEPFFIEGRPGRGKSFVVDALACRLRCEGRIVLIVGTSALAAALHERGRTAHSLFRIPVHEV